MIQSKKKNLKQLSETERKKVAGGFYSKPGHPDYNRPPGSFGYC